MPKRSAAAADPPELDPARLFAALKHARGLVAAVSGGPDSTALMLLLARWADRPPVLVVTIDHGLRPQSGAEARQVVLNAERLGLPARIMRAPQRLGGNLQAWAREARYALLAEAAREDGFDTIVTAHHREDQAETFLLRLARGSGVYGLSAMSGETTVAGLRLARPLLGVAGHRLADMARGSNLPVTLDPSNHDTRFDRVRLRRLMPLLATHGMGPQRLAVTAAHMRRAAAALDFFVGALLREHFAADPLGAVSGRVEAIEGCPEEVSLRSLALLIAAVGGATYPPGLERLERLHAALCGRGAARFKRTLHGVMISVAGGRIVFAREWGRLGPAAIPASPGRILWDARFEVEVPKLAAGMEIAPLGRSDRRLRSPVARTAALRTLPGLFADGALLAAPDFVTVDGAVVSPLWMQSVVAARLGLDGPTPSGHHFGIRELQ